MITPLISICIPIYNGSHYLEASIKSALAQQFNGSFEILLVDDCSSDSSFEIAKKVENDNKDIIRVIRSKTNRGLIENWNFCLKEAKGEWIKFLFQDDLLAPDCLQKMFDFGKDNNLPFVLCDREYFFEENIHPDRKLFLEEKLKRLSNFYKKPTVLSVDDLTEVFIKNYFENVLGEPIVGLFKRDLVEKIGYFHTDLKQIADLEYWLRIGLNYGVGFLPEKLVKFRVHLDSTSQANSKGLASFTDRIILGHLLMETDYYYLFRNKISKEISIEKMYMDLLKKYIDRFGYFQLKENLPNRAEYKHFARLRPGVETEIKYKLRTWLNKLT